MNRSRGGSRANQFRAQPQRAAAARGLDGSRAPVAAGGMRLAKNQFLHGRVEFLATRGAYVGFGRLHRQDLLLGAPHAVEHRGVAGQVAVYPHTQVDFRWRGIGSILCHQAENRIRAQLLEILKQELTPHFLCRHIIVDAHHDDPTHLHPELASCPRRGRTRSAAADHQPEPAYHRIVVCRRGRRPNCRRRRYERLPARRRGNCACRRSVRARRRRPAETQTHADRALGFGHAPAPQGGAAAAESATRMSPNSITWTISRRRCSTLDGSPAPRPWQRRRRAAIGRNSRNCVRSMRVARG